MKIELEKLHDEMKSEIEAIKEDILRYLTLNIVNYI
jgi:hypothetical protein